MLQNYKIKIEGIHCQSCKTLIETEIDVLTGVNTVEVNHLTGDTKIEFDNDKISFNKIIQEIEKLNYKVVKNDNDDKKIFNKNKLFWLKPFLTAFLIPIVLVLIILGYFYISKNNSLEILSKLNQGNVSYGLIFLIGILASFHCVGMCGGLVIAYSANDLKNKKTIKISAKPHFQYNIGRLISYSVIGGILGGIGTFFAINPTFTGIITFTAGVFMVIMGLSFLTNWKILAKIKLRTPHFIAKYLYNQKHSKNPLGPFIVGLLNGFMPCGPLQAMQLYALASGSVTKGILSMGFYALGTIPLMFGFGAFLSSIGNKKIKLIIKISGILVIILGVFMLNRGLTNFGYGFKYLSGNENISKNEYSITNNELVTQIVNMELGYFGYEPNVLFVKKGIPVKWIINVKQMSGCTDEIIMPEYNIKKKLQLGENIIEFTPDKIGEIKFSCWMKMVWGKFVVSDTDKTPSNIEIQKQTETLPFDTTCESETCSD